MHLPRSILYPLVFLFCLGGVCFHILKEISPFLFPVLFVLLLGTYFLLKNKQKVLKSVFLYTLYFCLGFLNFQCYYFPNNDHYLKASSSSSSTDLKIIEILEKTSENSFSISYLGKIKQWADQKTSGKLLLNQKKDSFTKSYFKGQKILTSAIFKPLPKTLNPGAFSYKKYLENQSVYQQMQLHSKNSVVLDSPKNKVQKSLNAAREYSISKIRESSLSLESKGMLQALLLAERKTINTELIDQYARAGVIHLLALSGLHIGLIVEILLVLFWPLRFLRFGNLIRLSLVIILLWAFALFVNFPASIVRSVTLFSFLTLVRFINHGRNSFHLTLVSLLLLLTLYPPYLKQIGFQFSFLAVLGILWIHPILQKIYRPKKILIKKYWEWTTVCLAAQIAVGPLSVFYFHQFPSLFLISNLMIIPFFGVFLSIGIGVFVLLLIEITPPILITTFDTIVDLLNNVVAWIATNDPFHLVQLHFPLFLCLCVYALSFFVLLFIEQKKFNPLIAITISLGLILGFAQVEKSKMIQESSFWIFHQYRQSLYGHLQSGIFYYNASDFEKTKTVLSDFASSRPLKQFKKLPARNFYIQKSFSLFILDDEQPYQIHDFSPTHILLRNNPKINLNRLLATYRPKLIIADGSNAPWFISRWEKSCQQQGVPFYNTGKEGALKISL